MDIEDRVELLLRCSEQAMVDRMFENFKLTDEEQQRFRAGVIEQLITNAVSQGAWRLADVVTELNKSVKGATAAQSKEMSEAVNKAVRDALPAVLDKEVPKALKGVVAGMVAKVLEDK